MRTAPRWCRAGCSIWNRVARPAVTVSWSRGDIEIASADAYEPTLMAEGRSSRTSAIGAPDIEAQLVGGGGTTGPSLGGMPTCSKK